MALIIGAIVAFVQDYDPALCVPAGGAGVLIHLLIYLHEWWQRGFSPNRLMMVSSALGLLCGIPGYYFADNTTIVIICMLGFFFFMLLAFVGRVWDLIRDTRRYLARRNRRPQGGAFKF